MRSKIDFFNLSARANLNCLTHGGWSEFSLAWTHRHWRRYRRLDDARRGLLHRARLLQARLDRSGARLLDADLMVYITEEGNFNIRGNICYIIFSRVCFFFIWHLYKYLYLGRCLRLRGWGTLLYSSSVRFYNIHDDASRAATFCSARDVNLQSLDWEGLARKCNIIIGIRTRKTC